MRNKTMPRLLAAFLALLLCMGAFSVTAFAYGGETETDGSMAPYDPEPGAAEMKDTEAASDTEDTGDGSQTEGVADTDTLAEEQISDLLSALIGARGNITVTDNFWAMCGNCYGRLYKNCSRCCNRAYRQSPQS